MAWLKGKQYKIVKGAADNGNKLANDILINVASMSEEELGKKLDEFFDSHFDEIEKGTRERRATELVNRFTGKSEKWNYKPEEVESALDTLEKATGHREFTPETIKQFIKQSRIVQTEYIKSKEDTSIIDTPERRRDRKSWIRDEINDQQKARKIKNDRVALISLGDAGVGKSSSGGENFLNQFGAYEVDPDNMKKRIPEFINDYNMLGMVHKESGQLADEMFDQVIEKGANVFVPKTGKKFSSIKELVDKLREKGYKVYCDFVDLDDKEENILRTEARGIITRRYTNPSVIRASYGRNYGVFERIKDEVDGWRYYNNGKLEENGGDEL